MNEVKLNIGAGRTYIPGYVNIDISPKADVTLDLSQDVLPFEDSSVDLVFSYHTLEHVDNYLFALGEIHRVLKHGRPFLLGLPYVTLTQYHLVNPYHHHNFNEYSFYFFDPDKLKGSAVEENPILFQKVFHHFHYIGMFHLVPPPFRSWCRRHLLNVVRAIDFGLLAIKYPQQRITVSTKDRFRLQLDLFQCLFARIPYDSPLPRQGKKQFPWSMSPRKIANLVQTWWKGGL